MAFNSLDTILHLSFITPTPLEIGQNLEINMRVELRNPKLDSLVKGGNFYYNGGDQKYFRPTKFPVQNLQGTKMRLDVLTSASVETIPSSLCIELRTQDDIRIQIGTWTMEINDFAGSLYPKPGDDAVRNILIFGLAGSTKSSFINSAYSMLSKAVQLGIAQAGGKSDRVTVDLTPYKLIDMDRDKATKYRIWDTWGLERDNYEACEFENIIHGKASPGWTMTDVSKMRLGDLCRIPADVRFVQNSLIFFVPMAEMDTQDSELLLKTRDFMERATENTISSILVLTKVDLVVPGFRENPSIKNDQIAARLNKACLFFSLSPARVFPLVNYYTNSTKNIEIDRLILKILLTSTNIADNHVLSHMKTVASSSDQKKRSLMFDLFLKL